MIAMQDALQPILPGTDRQDCVDWVCWLISRRRWAIKARKSLTWTGGTQTAGMRFTVSSLARVMVSFLSVGSAQWIPHVSSRCPRPTHNVGAGYRQSLSGSSCRPAERGSPSFFILTTSICTRPATAAFIDHFLLVASLVSVPSFASPQAGEMRRWAAASYIQQAGQNKKP